MATKNSRKKVKRSSKTIKKQLVNKKFSPDAPVQQIAVPNETLHKIRRKALADYCQLQRLRDGLYFELSEGEIAGFLMNGQAMVTRQGKVIMTLNGAQQLMDLTSDGVNDPIL